MDDEHDLEDQYRTGQISLRDAAHRLGSSLSETLDAFRQRGITGNVTADDTLGSLQSLSPEPRS